MAKLNLVNGGDRGRPRTNRKDGRGNVRVAITLPSNEGNISRTFTVANATVTEIFALLTRNFSTPKVAAKTTR